MKMKTNLNLFAICRWGPILRKISSLGLLGLVGLQSGLVMSAPADLPLFGIENMEYQGAFRIPNIGSGVSQSGSAPGIMAYNPEKKSLILVGHVREQAIAEIAIPSVSKSSKLTDLPMAPAPLQPFVNVLNRAPSGNPQSLDRIGGMLVRNGKLLINSFKYYDADQSVTHTTMLLDDVTKLGTSSAKGFYSLDPRAHAAGWLSVIPSEWRALLGGSYIAGGSSGDPITNRWSIGPSAFVFNPDSIGATVTLLDFPSTEPLHTDLRNGTGSNDLWTQLSHAVYGLIVPGTRTYMTIGFSGGNDGGVGYKITQDSGNLCGGYCSYIAKDNYSYYWLWDMNDLLKVKSGSMKASAVRPYKYGIFTVPFGSYSNQVGGGTFDESTNTLYIAVTKADTSQGDDTPTPVFLTYKLGGVSVTTPPNPPSNINIAPQ